MHKKAFTLIELLIVVAVIGLITGIATMSYSSVTKRSRDAQRKNDINQIKVALTTYYNAQVPMAFIAANSRLTIDGSSDTVSTTLEPNYIKAVPVDPINTGNNIYKYQSYNSAADFTLYGTLENTNDKKGWGGGTAWAADGYQISND